MVGQKELYAERQSQLLYDQPFGSRVVPPKSAQSSDSRLLQTSLIGYYNTGMLGLAPKANVQTHLLAGCLCR